MHEAFFTARLLNSLLIGLGDWIVLAGLVRLFRLRSPSFLRLLYGAALIHTALAWFFVSPSAPIQFRWRLVSGDAFGAALEQYDSLVLGLWCGGTLLALLWRVLRARRLQRLLRGLDELADAPDTALTVEMESLATELGVVAPRLRVVDGGVLPPFLARLPLPASRPHAVLFLSRGTLEALKGGERRAVLAHELAHLRHGGRRWAQALDLLRAPFFFHWPFGRLLAAYSLEVEKACDQDACRLLGARGHLASSLLKVAAQGRSRLRAHHARGARLGRGFAWPRPGTAELQGRLRQLAHLSPRGNFLAPRWAGALQVLLVLSCAPLCPTAGTVASKNAIELKQRAAGFEGLRGRLVFSPLCNSPIQVAFQHLGRR